MVQSAWKDATSGEWLERGELPGRKVSDYAVVIIEKRCWESELSTLVAVLMERIGHS